MVASSNVVGVVCGVAVVGGAGVVFGVVNVVVGVSVDVAVGAVVVASVVIVGVVVVTVVGVCSAVVGCGVRGGGVAVCSGVSVTVSTFDPFYLTFRKNAPGTSIFQTDSSSHSRELKVSWPHTFNTT